MQPGLFLSCSLVLQVVLASPTTRARIHYDLRQLLTSVGIPILVSFNSDPLGDEKLPARVTLKHGSLVLAPPTAFGVDREAQDAEGCAEEPIHAGDERGLSAHVARPAKLDFVFQRAPARETRPWGPEENVQKRIPL